MHLDRRDADAALEVLQAPLWQDILAEGLARTAHAMQSAIAWQLKGDSEKVREMDELIVSRIEEVAGSSFQEQVYGGSDAALSLARLGRHEEGLRLVNQVMELAPYERDALLWCTMLERRAMVRAMAGDADGALEDLAEALRTPCAFSVTRWQLHYDPLWDFFRDNPGFLELSTPDNLVREAQL